MIAIAREDPFYFVGPSDGRFRRALELQHRAVWNKAVSVAYEPDNLRARAERFPEDTIASLSGFSRTFYLRKSPEMAQVLLDTAGAKLNSAPPSDPDTILQYAQYLTDHPDLVAETIKQNPEKAITALATIAKNGHQDVLRVPAVANSLKVAFTEHPLDAFGAFSSINYDPDVQRLLTSITAEDVYRDVERRPLAALEMLHTELSLSNNNLVSEKSHYTTPDSSIPKQFRAKAEQIALNANGLIEDAKDNPDQAFRLLSVYATKPYAKDVLSAALGVERMASSFFQEYREASTALKKYKIPLEPLERTAHQTIMNGLNGPNARTTALQVVHAINMLHEPGNQDIRYSSIEEFDAHTLFTLIAQGREELYTSSYNGILDRLLPQIRNPEQAERFFSQITSNENRFLLPAFLEAGAAYRRIHEIFNAVPSQELRSQLISSTFDTLKESLPTGRGQTPPNLKFAVSLTDTMLSLAGRPELREVLGQYEAELMKRFKESPPNSDVRKALGMVTSAYLEVQPSPINPELFRGEKNSREYFREHFPVGGYTTLPGDRLFKDGVHRQRVIFYGDDDAKASFEHFKEEFAKDPRWAPNDHGSYIVFTTTRNNRTVEVVANKPGDPEGMDAVDRYFSSNNASPQSIVHRGHSYHTEDTMPYIKGDLAYVSWGSCGGYQLSAETAQRVPGAHISGTAGTGAMGVNDGQTQRHARHWPASLA